MEKATRTVYASKLQTAMLLGLPYVVDENSTLNERFSVEADAVLADDVYPRMKYMAYGNGGHKVVVGADNTAYTTALQHAPSDAAPFKPLPWVLRQVSADLSPQERAKYAMRCVQTYNGDQYFAYYLKRLDMANLLIKMQLRTVVDGVTTSVDFVPGPENLVPTPTELANAGANELLAKYLTVSALLTLTLTETDVQEMLNVSRIIRGDENYAIISELCLCSGADKVIGLTDGSNFKEAIAAQVMSFVSTMHQMRYTANGLVSLLDVGTNEPLYVVAP